MLQKNFQTKICPGCQEISLERLKNGSVPDVFVSEDQGLLCIDIDITSPVQNTACIRIGRGGTQWARQSSEFAPEIEGSDCVFTNAGTAIAQAQPKDPNLCIGTPIACHPEITPPPPSSRLQPGQPDSARLGIGRQSPSLLQKDTSKPGESHIGDRRWFTVVTKENSYPNPNNQHLECVFLNKIGRIAL